MRITTKLMQFINELQYYIDMIYGFQKLEKDIFFKYSYDIPSSSDQDLNGIHIKYLEDNFYKFDIVVFMIDIKSDLPIDEMFERIILLMKKEMKKNKKIHLVCCVNKFDGLQCNDDSIEITDDIQQKNFNKIKETISNISEKHDMNDYCNHICPISLEEAYIYRLCKKYDGKIELENKQITKLGVNEYGKKKWNNKANKKDIEQLLDEINKDENYNRNIEMTGFKNFSNIVNSIFEKSQYDMLMNHLINRLEKIKKSKNIDNKIITTLKKYITLNEQYEKLLELFKKQNDFTLLKNKFDNEFDNILSMLSNVINMEDTNIFSSKIDNNAFMEMKNIKHLINEIQELKFGTLIDKKHIDNLEKFNKEISDVMYKYTIDLIVKSKELTHESFYNSIKDLKDAKYNDIENIILNNISKIRIADILNDIETVDMLKKIQNNIIDNKEFIVKMIFKIFYMKIKTICNMYCGNVMKDDSYIVYLLKLSDIIENKIVNTTIKDLVFEYKKLHKIINNTIIHCQHISITNVNFIDDLINNYTMDYDTLYLEAYLNSIDITQIFVSSNKKEKEIFIDL